MLELPFLRVIVIDMVEKFLVKVRPFLKCKLLSEDARTHVSSNHGSFY